MLRLRQERWLETDEEKFVENGGCADLGVQDWL